MGFCYVYSDMLREDCNIFERDKINWESWVESLLWTNIVYRKNEYSGFDILIKPEEYMKDHYKKGDIVGDVRFRSYSIGMTRPLTWKELALVLGFFKDHLTPDGHDCKICEDRETCPAFFKDDLDQERCSGWMEKHGKPDDVVEYQKFIDKLFNEDWGPIRMVKIGSEEYNLLDIKTDE